MGDERATTQPTDARAAGLSEAIVAIRRAAASLEHALREAERLAGRGVSSKDIAA